MPPLNAASRAGPEPLRGSSSVRGKVWVRFPRLKADVAQLVERLIRNQQVTGSNPVVGSSFS
jgi:hypothetical protein